MVSARAQCAAVAAIEALGPLSHDDEINIARVGQGAGRTRVQLRRTEVHRVVQLEAQRQQQAALQHAGGHGTRVADGAQQDSVVLA